MSPTQKILVTHHNQVAIKSGIPPIVIYGYLSNHSATLTKVNEKLSTPAGVKSKSPRLLMYTKLVKDYNVPLVEVQTTKLAYRIHTHFPMPSEHVWSPNIFRLTFPLTKYKLTWKFQSYVKNKNQLDATYYFTVLLIRSTCFRHYYTHHQEHTTIMLITTLVVSFCTDGRGSVNAKLWFLVVCVRCEVLCRSVVLDWLIDSFIH